MLVKWGSRGAALFTAQGEHWWPPHTVDVVDTTGAGDAFCGALASWLAEGTSIEDALTAAVVAGSLATREMGARGASPERAELEEAILAHPQSRV